MQWLFSFANSRGMLHWLISLSNMAESGHIQAKTYVASSVSENRRAEVKVATISITPARSS